MQEQPPALPVQSGREPSHFLPASDSIDLYLLFTQLSKNTALRASQQIAVGWWFWVNLSWQFCCIWILFCPRDWARCQFALAFWRRRGGSCIFRLLQAPCEHLPFPLLERQKLIVLMEPCFIGWEPALLQDVRGGRREVRRASRSLLSLLSSFCFEHRLFAELPPPWATTSCWKQGSSGSGFHLWLSKANRLC